MLLKRVKMLDYTEYKSVFLGEIEENDFDELKQKMEDIIDLDSDSVYIFQ
ncbi:MAG: CRISPR-associated endonuclease Cas2 [Intestinibacter bartlettii]